MTGNFGNWEFTSHNNSRISAISKKVKQGMKIVLKDKIYSGGRWEGILDITDTDKKYTISVNYKLKSKNSKVLAVIHQVNDEGFDIASDYLTENKSGGLEISIEILDKCTHLRLTLVFSSYGRGECLFFTPQIKITKKETHRIINVATSYFERKWYKNCEDNIPHILKIIENASKDENSPDILCFTETTYDRGVLLPFNKKAVDENSDILKLIKEKAKEHKMYIIFGVHEKEDDRMYNTAYIISPDGKIAGKYRKTHFTYSEILSEMTPGDDIPVFDLKFGRVGLMICWDQWYPEMARKLCEKGAEIIFVLTAGNPECLSRARAYENGVFVVVSGCEDNNPQASFIVDQYGEIIGAVENEEKGYVSVPVDLDAHKRLRYLSFPWGYGANVYKTEKRKDLY